MRSDARRSDETTFPRTFPYKLPEGTILADTCTAIDQLEYVKRLQTEWSDNSVSVTVYYRKHELPEIKEWLKKNYNNSIKTVSFLLHSDHGFIQAPMEQITKQEYEELKQLIAQYRNNNSSPLQVAGDDTIPGFYDPRTIGNTRARQFFGF